MSRTVVRPSATSPEFVELSSEFVPVSQCFIKNHVNHQSIRLWDAFSNSIFECEKQSPCWNLSQTCRKVWGRCRERRVVCTRDPNVRLSPRIWKTGLRLTIVKTGESLLLSVIKFPICFAVCEPLCGLLHLPRIRGDGEWRAIDGMRIGKRNQSTRTIPAIMPLYPPRLPHYQTWAWSQAPAVGTRWLTDRAIVLSLMPLEPKCHVAYDFQVTELMAVWITRMRTLWGGGVLCPQRRQPVFECTDAVA
jgi:hypothetical protein